MLVQSGGAAVKYLSKIARFLKWSEFMVAFLLMAVTTSLPEWFVGVTSALHKTPEISFGNVIGANIINLTFAVALPVLIAGVLGVYSLMARRTSIYASVIAFLPVLLILDKKLSRIDGVILLLCLAFYLQWILRNKEKFSRVFNGGESNKIPRASKKPKVSVEEALSGMVQAPIEVALTLGSFFKALASFFVAALLLLASAEGIVWSAGRLASNLKLPLHLISIILVALGTTLPEVVFSIKALSLKHKEMILGNLMGSVIINSTLVLGTAVVIYPFKALQFSPYLVGIVFAVATLFFFNLFTRSHNQINRKEGLFLLFIYLLFIVVQFLIR